MRCKKHVPDLTSTIGVCASCLRERLEAILAAQARAQARAQAQAQPARVAAAPSSSDHNNQPKKPAEPNPPPLNAPNSASPHVSRRKSDFAGRNGRDRHLDRLFYSTPQVGPAFSAAAAGCDRRTTKRRLGRFWNLASLFRIRSNKPEPSPRESSCAPSSSSAATASPAWLSTILRKNREDDHGGSNHRQSDRETEESGNEIDGHDKSSSAGSGISSESSPRRRNQAAAPARRSRLGPAEKSVMKLAFCLSPLVRASPKRHWSHKGLAQELGAPVGGAHHHIATAASFCANRSRKLADFGRVGHNH